MKTEFGVYLIQPLGRWLARVGVRVHSGTVHVGDCFVDAQAASLADAGTDEARLEVTKIEAFRLHGEDLQCGMTGYVMVRGTGVPRLSEGSVLRLLSALA